MLSLRLSPESAQKLNLAGDLVLVAGAAMLASLNGGHLHWKVGLVLCAAAWAFWMGASRVLAQYRVASGRGLLGDVALTMVLLVAAVIPVLVLRSLSPRLATTIELTRYLALLVPAVLALRLASAGFRALRTRPVEQVLVLGVGSLGRLTRREVAEGRKHQTVLGHLHFPDEQPGHLEAPELGAVEDLETVLRERVVNEVYVASSAPAHHDAAQRAIATCERLGVPFAVPAGGYRLARAVPASQSAVPDGYVHYLSVRPHPLQWQLKRLLDVAVSASALMLLSPLLVLTALAIKLSSRGPVFFKQERVGLCGRTFQMLKFRSMVTNAEALKAALLSQNERSGPVFKMVHDPRVTAVGRFLRKHSIDELPQIVNVLRGDMSLVGPRPALPTEVARYEAWQRRRLSVRPGLTCLWQVDDRGALSFGSWMLLDMRYIDHWSLWSDLRLIALTVPVVLSGRGAS